MIWRAATLSALLVVALVQAVGAQTPAERAAAVVATVPADATVVTFERLNRTWRDLEQELAPVTQGAMTLELSSPSWWVTVKSHRLALAPAAEGRHMASFELELMGRGDLVADLRAGNATSRLSDEVVLPLQRLSITAPVLLALSPQGLLVTPLELPESLSVTAESGLASQMVTACNALVLLALGALDCDAVEAGMTRLAVPLPEAGRTYLLPAAEITEEERQAVERYLGGG